jgi:hypothetical protein
VSSLTNATQYAFVVTATVNGVESAESNVLTATPDFLNAPFATLVGGLLTWYWPGGADLTNSTGASEYYAVEESTDGNFASSTPVTATIGSGLYHTSAQAGITLTTGHWYRVAHMASSTGPVDSLYSSSFQD